MSGTAFDYLARAQIVRHFQRAGVKLYVETSTIDRVEEHIRDATVSLDQERQWMDYAAAAKDKMTEYAAGRGDLRDLASWVQYIAFAEMAFRSSRSLDPEFKPIGAVSDELLRLIEIFNPVARYNPRKHCFLNPIFVAAPLVGGADGDIVVDDVLIDLKTTKKASVDAKMLRQLAGYAALQSIGGIRIYDNVHTTPFESVELYFARYGKSVSWAIADLFPNDGFSGFCSVIRGIVQARQKQRDEIMERVSLFEAKQKSKKIAAAKRKMSKKTTTSKRVC